MTADRRPCRCPLELDRLRRRTVWSLVAGVALGSTGHIAAVDRRDDRRPARSPGTTAWSGAPGAAVVLGAALGAVIAVAAHGPPRPPDRAGRRLRDRRRRRARRDRRGRRRLAAAAPGRHGPHRLRQRSNQLSRYVAADLYPADRRASAIGIVVWGATVGAVVGPNLVGAGRRPWRVARPARAGRARTSCRSCSSARPRSCRSSLLRPDPYELADDVVAARPSRRPTATAASRSRSVLAPAERAGRDRRPRHGPGRDGPDHDDDAAPHDRPRPRPGGGRARHQRPHVRDVRAVADLGPPDRPFGSVPVILAGLAVTAVRVGPRRGRAAGRRRRCCSSRCSCSGYGWNLGYVAGLGAADPGPVARRADPAPGPHRRLIWSSAAAASLGSGRRRRGGRATRRSGCWGGPRRRPGHAGHRPARGGRAAGGRRRLSSGHGAELPTDPRGEDPGARLDLVERHVLVGAVGDPHVARAEDHARRAAVVDEQLHVGAVRLAEQRRPAARDAPRRRRPARPAADGPTAPAPTRTGRR